MSEEQQHHRDLDRILRAKLSDKGLASTTFDGPGDHIWEEIESSIRPNKKRKVFWLLIFGVLSIIALVGFSYLGLRDVTMVTAQIEETSGAVSKLSNDPGIIEAPLTEKVMASKEMTTESSGNDMRLSSTQRHLNPLIHQTLEAAGNINASAISSDTDTDIAPIILDATVLTTDNYMSKGGVTLVSTSDSYVEEINKAYQGETSPVLIDSAEVIREEEMTYSTPLAISKLDLTPFIISSQMPTVERAEQIHEESSYQSEQFIIEGKVSYGRLGATTRYNYSNSSGDQNFVVSGNESIGGYLRILKPVLIKTRLGIEVGVKDVHFDGSYELNAAYDSRYDILGSEQYTLKTEIPTYAGAAQVSFSLDKGASEPIDQQRVGLDLTLNHGVRLYQFSVLAQRELWSNKNWEAHIGGMLGYTLRDNAIETPGGIITVHESFDQGGTITIDGLSNQAGLSDDFFHLGLEASLVYRLSSRSSIGLSLSTLRYLSTTTPDTPFDISLSEFSSGLVLRYSF